MTSLMNPDAAIQAPPAMADDQLARPCAGLCLEGGDWGHVEQAASLTHQYFEELGLHRWVDQVRLSDRQQPAIQFSLTAHARSRGMPAHDTTALSARLDLHAFKDGRHLEREIVLAMLGSPLAYVFPSLDELQSAIRIRSNIVSAGHKAMLDFHTTEVNRPEDCWTYVDGAGFVLNRGKSLTKALELALIPSASGRKYSFSCYRATEYVMLLGIAQELQRSNAELYAALEARWRIDPIASRAFHDTFLVEHGGMDLPLPLKFYIPGDRVWFRNPDPHSSDASGYEGSWVIYLGDGLFTNFWDAARPFTLRSKCVEIYHWRHAVFVDAEGEPRIDEAKVRSLAEASMADEAEVARIWDLMARHRDPSGVYEQGGCIDTSREHARRVRPATSDLLLPPLD